MSGSTHSHQHVSPPDSWAKCRYLKLRKKSPSVCCLPLFATPSPPPVFTFFLSVGAACWGASWMETAVCLGCKRRRQREEIREGGGWAVEALSCWLHPFLLCPTCQSRQEFLKCHVALGILAANPITGSKRNSYQN